MTHVAITVSSGMTQSAASEAVAIRGGEKIGVVQVTQAARQRIDLRVPGELGFGRALVGLVPIVWCAAAWTLCLREHLLAERLHGCIALSLMAGVSAILMVSSLGVAWRVDWNRRQITRRVGLFG